MTVIKYSIFFVFSFLILSIPVSQEPLFIHLYKPLKPYIKVIFNEVEEKSKDKIKEGKEFLILKKAGLD